MGTAVLDRAPSLFDAPSPGVSAPWRNGRGPMRRDEPAPARPAAPAQAAAPTTTAGVGGRARLEDVVSGVWEDLIAHRTAACLMCGGRMAPRYGAAGVAPVGGRCTDCGSVLG